MARKALIVWGGWVGHQPKEVGELFERVLKQDGFEVERSDTLDAFRDETKLKSLSLIVPIWTMDKITNEQLGPVVNAVKSGVGMAGCHGGMCDAFREATEWQFMTGGQWVAHPGNDGPHVGNGPVDMPVLWTKAYGSGRVFYSSIGHTPAAVEAEPHLTLLRRGFRWAAA